MHAVEIISAEQADLDEIVELQRRMGTDGPSSDELRWALQPPAGAARVALCRIGEELHGVVAARPLVYCARAERQLAWQICLNLHGPRSDGSATFKSLLDVLPRSHAVLHHGALSGVRPPGPWQSIARARAWLTGPDPFVPLQPAVQQLDHRHDRLAEVLCGQVQACTVRDAAWLRWRYLEHPTHSYTLMEISDDDVCHGIIVVRIATVSGRRAVLVVDLHAVDDRVRYALLKAARRLSWQEGSPPVVVIDDQMQRLYALSAGYVAVPRRWMSKFEVHAIWGSSSSSRWHASLGDWTKY